MSLYLTPDFRSG